MARAGSSGSDSTLWMYQRSSKQTRKSVKVPPVSIPTRKVSAAPVLKFRFKLSPCAILPMLGVPQTFRIAYFQDTDPPENSEQTIARIVYGAASNADATQLRLALPLLGARILHEVWSSDQPVVRGAESGFHTACFGSFMFAYGVFEETDAGLQVCTRQVYQRLLALTREYGYPSILRVWNHFPEICMSDGVGARYREFCDGRREAWLADTPSAQAPLPAVTTTGSQAQGLVVYFLAAREAGVALHNPRQTAPSEYPPELGPHGPSFSRGMLHEETGICRLYLSGTASITGHETQHAGDVAEQTREVLRNHTAVLEQAHQLNPTCPTQVEALPFEKVYLARPEDVSAVSAVLRERVAAPQYVLHSPLCRGDLLLEMESCWMP